MQRQHAVPPFIERHREGALDGGSGALLVIDITDSVCPYPMTRVSLDQYLDAFAGQITLWGGIPSILLCPDSTPEEQFRHSIDSLIRKHGHRPRFVLGVSDMVIVDAEWSRLEYITDRVKSIT